MLCGVIAMAAATEQALTHPDQPLAPDIRVALGVGAVLFVCGTAAAMLRATGRLPAWRVLLAPAAAIAVIAGGAAPGVAMALLLAMLAALAAIEHRQPTAR